MTGTRMFLAAAITLLPLPASAGAIGDPRPAAAPGWPSIAAAAPECRASCPPVRVPYPPGAAAITTPAMTSLALAGLAGAGRSAVRAARLGEAAAMRGLAAWPGPGGPRASA